MPQTKPTLAILGGTGDLGGGLAWRWARAGYPVILGSRQREKGEAAARELRAELGATEDRVRGTDNAAAAAAADIVVLTVPYEHQQPTLDAVREQLSGKLLIDCTVPLRPPKVGRVQLPAEGSAAVAAQQRLGDAVTVVSAFQNVGAAHLRSEHAIDCDVLVSGDSVDARQRVIELAEAAGLRAWHAGPLANSAAAEALTSVLIQINKRYGIDGAGIRITGKPKA